jgi:hypothetical protein
MERRGRPRGSRQDKGETMSRTRFRYVVPTVLALSLAASSFAIAAGGGKSGKGNHGQSGSFFASLSGREEVPAIHTGASARFKLTMTNSTTFSYELTYSGLSGNPAAAHIHFAQPGANGGVIVDLCGGTKPACPAATSGTVTGTFAAADVKAIPAQGFAAGDFAGFVDELRAGFMYANMHTAAFPGGEIRGQISGDRGKHVGWGRGHGKGKHRDDDDD